MQQRTPATVRAFMRSRKWSQQELAVNAGVSQATVSRALERIGRRQGSGRDKLFIYIETEYLAESGLRVPEEVVRAFTRIWDGTSAHTSAVVKIIDALEGLRPKEPAA